MCGSIGSIPYPHLPNFLLVTMAPRIDVVLQQLAQARQHRARLFAQLIQADRYTSMLEQQLLAATTTRCPCCAFDSDCIPSPIPQVEDAPNTDRRMLPTVITTEVSPKQDYTDVVFCVHSALAAAITGDMIRYKAAIEQGLVLPICKVRVMAKKFNMFADDNAAGVLLPTALVSHDESEQPRQVVFTSLVGASGVVSQASAMTLSSKYSQIATDAEAQYVWQVLKNKCREFCLYPQTTANEGKSIVWALFDLAPPLQQYKRAKRRSSTAAADPAEVTTFVLQVEVD